MGDQARTLVGVRSYPAIKLENGEKVEVWLELDDEGWKKSKTGALNIRNDSGEIEESIHFPNEGLRIMGRMLNVSKRTAAQGSVLGRIVKEGRITSDPANIHFLRTMDGAMICHQGVSLYTLKADPSRCLGNECNQLANEGSIEG